MPPFLRALKWSRYCFVVSTGLKLSFMRGFSMGGIWLEKLPPRKPCMNSAIRPQQLCRTLHGRYSTSTRIPCNEGKQMLRSYNLKHS